MVARASGEREDTHARDGRQGVRGERGNARTDGLEALGRPEDGALGSVFGRRQRATGPEERRGQAQHERPVRVSVFVFTPCICLLDPLILLISMFLSRLLDCRGGAKHAPRLAPTKALKNGAHATPHSAPRALLGVEPILEAGAVRLHEAVARGTLES